MKLKRILIFPAVAMLTVLALAASDYLKYIELADGAVAKKDWDHAEQLLRAAMEAEPSNPQNVMLLSNIGMFQFYRGEDSLALHTLSEARAIAPAATVILANRAKVLQHMGRVDDALKDYDRLIEMDTVNYNGYFERGYILLQRGDSIGARRDFSRLEQLRPDDPNTLLVLAVMYSNLGHHTEAISYYNRLIDKVQKPEFYTGRAMSRLIKGDLLEAADDIARGLELAPEDGELYFCRAYLHLLQYRKDEAEADAKQAVRFGVSQERIDELFQ